MAGENCRPPLPLSASGAMDGGILPLRSPTPIEALSVRSSSPATSTPSLEQQKSGEIHEEKAAGEVLGDAHASDDLLEVSHVTGEVCGKPEPPYSEVDGDFWQKKSRKKN